MLIWWGLGFFFIFWFVGVIANLIAWWAGKKRLDVLTFLYLPLWSLWLLAVVMIGLGWSVVELYSGRHVRWVDSVGAKITLAGTGMFLGVWLGSVISGVVLRYFFKWADGPTPKPLPPVVLDPNQGPPLAPPKP
jgi:hypothetical protein